MMRVFLLFITLFATTLRFAQQTITGTVTDDTGEPIPGATILELNTSNGVVTDIDGNFSISVSGSDAVLRISFLGFETQEISVGARSVIDITLAQDLQELEEVVVVGYGTVRKSDLTGAVSSVELSENEAREFATVDQILQGRAAGVQVTQNSGSPGSGISVRIRGTNSLRGNNEPLYVVDGVIISSAGEDVNPAGGIGNSGQEVQNGLNGLNPRDIESIVVLKDASATAIYGSRGANGVVLITTKKGLTGKRKIDLFVNSGVRMMEDQRYDVLSGLDFARYQNEVQAMNYNNVRYHIDGDKVYPILEGGTLASTPAVLHDWQDEIYNVSEHYNFGGSVSGGDSEGSYYLSFGYTDQKGLVENSRFQSGDIRYNFDKIVIACGAFSKRLTDNLGEKIPLDTERGYHVHFKNCDHLLNRPVIFSNRGFGITPMEQGLRVVGTVEFGGLDNPLSKSRVRNLINNAKYMLGDLPEHEDEWLGFRPTLPDFLPVMGPSKNHKNVFYCFGHHHLGWTLGPISGKIVSGMIARENTNLNLDPYSSTRFN